jgi:hypothetical protein
MIRKIGNRFSAGQTRSLCPQIMLKQRDEIAMRFNRTAIWDAGRRASQDAIEDDRENDRETTGSVGHCLIERNLIRA